MDFNEYQGLAKKTAHYGKDDFEYKLMYLCLGLAGESGEVIEKVKKIIRNQDGGLNDERREFLKKELGDVLWYVSQLSEVLNISFNDVALANIEKLKDRDSRGKIKSEGDSR